MSLETILAYLRARAAEPSSQRQVAILVLMALLGCGVVSTEQIDALATKALLALSAIGPLVGFLTADKPSPEAVAAAAAALAENRPELAKVAAKVAQAEQAAGPLLESLRGRL